MALHEKFLETSRRGGTSVLLIDEAHLLTTELFEEIRLLSNSDSYNEKLLQIVLCGQPELISAFERRELHALRQRIVKVGRLRPLSLAETRAYIAQRLYAAGCLGNNLFAGPALEQIHRNTQGIPRLINLLCDGCLSIGAATKAKQIGVEIVGEALLGMAITDLPDVPVEREANQTIRLEAHTTLTGTLPGRGDKPQSIRMETPAPRSGMTILFEGIRAPRPASRE
jgi:general secretion pathway protein A